MHNLKLIRENLDDFKDKISKRNTKVDFDKLIQLDKKHREIIGNKEKLEQQKKIISKSQDKKQFKKSKNISNEINQLIIEEKKIGKKISQILDVIPNIGLDDVPVGSDEKSNKIINLTGEIPKFSFKVQSHYDLGKKKGLLDFDLASKTTGARFVFLKGKLAELERAISNFMLDVHTKEFGYEEVSPPLIASESTMYGTGQLPKFENDQFQIQMEGNQKKYLIPTAEVILTNMFKENTLNIKNLPKSQKVYDLTLSSNKEKKIISKDTAGDPLIFQILINVEYNVNKEGKLLIEKSFNRKIKYNNISDKFEMEKYEKNIIENLSINISDMIIGSISEVNQ